MGCMGCMGEVKLKVEKSQSLTLTGGRLENRCRGARRSDIQETAASKAGDVAHYRILRHNEGISQG